MKTFLLVLLILGNFLHTVGCGLAAESDTKSSASYYFMMIGFCLVVIALILW